MTALAVLLKYWREIATALLVLLLIGLALWIRGVFAERDELKRDKAVLTAQLQDAEQNLQLQNRITEAIGKIKVRSQVNVSRIESEPQPVFSGNPLPFISGGVLQAVYSSAAPPAAASGPAEGGSLSAGE